jgi:hypothetical protein
MRCTTMAVARRTLRDESLRQAGGGERFVETE